MAAKTRADGYKARRPPVGQRTMASLADDPDSSPRRRTRAPSRVGGCPGPFLTRHLAAARLPVGKSLDSFDFEAVSIISKAQVVALTTADSFNATVARRTSVASYAAQGPRPTAGAFATGNLFG
jgi:hypothetical protein